jgi:transcriptional regulator with XRE-family HTH domain
MKAEKPKDYRYPHEIKTIGDRLRVKRLEKGLIQREVAQVIGVSEDTICYWEKGRVSPSPMNVRKIERLLREIERP